ncbi:SPOR domain-containing protein [Candidatus Palibaumannia cicadellinicola]|uniref:Cell division protein DedD n=1 Tax=Candidatus Palibaumannia cicadellinicola TaxID=186490 RepID=A0A088MYL5_9GAMM|nr:SPOR domain-containing protein [Candidatus Baumannia cicadellinicola]AIN47284.1 cell division protein DedD [Candidatus Baumannia cicadellinicola]
MDSQFNKRLAGTIITVALGIIFLPSLLNGHKNNIHDEFIAIPLAPQLNKNKRDISFLANQQLLNNPQEKTIASSQQSKSIARPEHNLFSQPQAWVVQLGAFQNATKVSEIVAQLRLSGYTVYTSPSTPVQGKITRILVGPDASKEKLQRFIKELNQLSGLNGQLYPYITRVSTKQQ